MPSKLRQYTCKICDKEFSSRSWKEQPYCSHACAGVAQRKDPEKQLCRKCGQLGVFKRGYCKRCYNENQTKYKKRYRKEGKYTKKRLENKIRACELKGFRCAMCGREDRDHPEIYDFHHVDESTKSGKIGNMLYDRAWLNADLQAELAKCVLLCACCHRITHKG